MADATIKIPLLPLRDILVFPTTVVPLFVGREKSIQALEQAMSENREILLASQRKAKTSDPSPDEIYDVGTISTIRQLLRLPNGTVKVLVEGLRRARIESFIQTEEFFYVEATPLEEAKTDSVENEALIRTVKVAFDNYVRLNKRIPPEMLLNVSSIEDESKLADMLVAHLSHLKLADKQKLLEETNPRVRLEELYGFIQSEIEIMRVEKKIRARVKRQMEKTQKEYYLNEQMAAIQRELGDRDDSRAELLEIEEQIKNKKLSKEARDKLTKEVRKLKMMSPMSAEAAVVRNYLDTVLGLPWEEYSKEIRDIQFAEDVLNEDHYGLEKVKERILEFLSVRLIGDKLKSPILCLVGPPGVGKTSLARSVARATGREFVRIALGGVRDESEIRGHRRTYIGSMPGRIISGIKKAGKTNPVMLLDEIDKMGHDHRGDPSSALLEVLDPAQNHTFNDHFVDLDYDLSHVLFLATANTMHQIPGPLRDRMEIITLSGYTEQEKLKIAEQYLVPKQLQENGLNEQGIKFEEAAVCNIIAHYTKEAGVRNLEREIANVLRKVARKNLQKLDKKELLAKGKIKLSVKEKITTKSVETYLGPHRYRIGLQGKLDEIGVCTGLAWTEVGGDLLVAEVNVMPGKGKLTITGKLGEVMQESAQAALSYVRSRGHFLGLEEDFYQKYDIHVHVPEGAIPKDGPSAGLCMATAMISALTGRPVSRDVAMTGEITLRGRALAIGGLKEKLIAAHRGGIKKVLIPKENEKDLHEIPKYVTDHLKIITVEHMDTVLMHALVWKRSKDDLYKKLKQNISIPENELHFAH
jgi:ATP-dependent Lon protease